MASVPHGADAAQQWVCIVIVPDVCNVGGTPTPFDTFATLNNWAPSNPETRLRALTHPVYRTTDMLLGVQANAGNGVVSGVSQGTGYVLILAPCPPTRVVGVDQEIVVDQNLVMINTNGGGVGGAEGRIYTDVQAAIKAMSTAQGVLDKGTKAGEIAFTRFAPKAANGRFISHVNWNELSYAERAATYGRVAKPGMGSTVRVLGSTGKYLGVAGNVLTFAGGAVEQLDRDAMRTDLTETQRNLRAAGRGGIKTGVAAAGTWAGVEAGAAIGIWFGPVGAVVGGIVGGLVMGYAADKAGDNISDFVLDQPFAGGQ